MFNQQVLQYPGVIIQNYAVTTALTPGAITANTTYSTTVSHPSAQVGDEISVVCNAALGNVVAAGEVNAAGSITIKIQNCTAGSITPPSANYTAIGARYAPVMFT